MASSSCSTCMMNKSSFAPRVTNCKKELMFSYSSLVDKLPVHRNSFSLSADVSKSRLLLSHEKSMKWKQTQQLPLRNSIQCQAVETQSTPSFTIGKKFQLDDVIESQQFDRDILNAIFEVAREMERIEKHSPGSQILKGYLMATLFYEPSTRTRLSFESAMKRLGGEVLTTENAREFSSAAKGETLEGKYHFDHSSRIPLK